jgi:hypothetical protein
MGRGRSVSFCQLRTCRRVGQQRANFGLPHCNKLALRQAAAVIAYIHRTAAAHGVDPNDVVVTECGRGVFDALA